MHDTVGSSRCSRDLPPPVRANNVRKLAALRATRSILSKVRALPDMLLVAIKALFAVPQDRKVPTDTLAPPDVDVREEATAARAAPLVEKVNTYRRPLGCRVVRQLTSLGRVGATVLQKVPADGDLGRVVLIHACEAAVAGTCGREPRTRFVDLFPLLVPP